MENKITQVSKHNKKRKVETQDDYVTTIANTRTRKPTWISQKIENVMVYDALLIILGYLSVNTLKATRLVSRYWRDVSNFLLQKKAVVHVAFLSDQYLEFQNLINAAPLVDTPFRFLSLYFDGFITTIPQVTSVLNSKFLITKLNAWGLSMNLALPLITKISPTLEQLSIRPVNSLEQTSFVAEFDLNSRWPRLRDIVVEVYGHVESYCEYFPSIIATIVNGSPNMVTYMATCSNTLLGSNLVLYVNLTRVTRLILFRYCINHKTLKYFSSIQFLNLQTLQLDFDVPILEVDGSETKKLNMIEANVVKLIKKTAKSLTNLDLSNVSEVERIATFSTFRYVKELCLNNFTVASIQFLNLFPCLQTLVLNQFTWSEIYTGKRFRTTCDRIKCLKISNALNRKHLLDNSPIKFLDMFPQITSLYAGSLFITKAFASKSNDPIRFQHVLKTVQHIHIRRQYLDGVNINDNSSGLIYESLASVPGLKTITVSCFDQILFIPVNKLPVLKSITFPWPENHRKCTPANIFKVVMHLKHMNEVYVANCCRIRREGPPIIAKKLKQFFVRNSNANCGCSLNNYNIFGRNIV